MPAEERLNHVVQQLAVEVEIEHRKQQRIKPRQNAGDLAEDLKQFTDYFLPPCYQLMESSNSSSDGSSGSSCMTVVM